MCGVESKHQNWHKLCVFVSDKKSGTSVLKFWRDSWTKQCRTTLDIDNELILKGGGPRFDKQVHGSTDTEFDDTWGQKSKQRWFKGAKTHIGGFCARLCVSNAVKFWIKSNGVEADFSGIFGLLFCTHGSRCKNLVATECESTEI